VRGAGRFALGLAGLLCGVVAGAAIWRVNVADEGPAWLDRCTALTGEVLANRAFQRDMDASMVAMMSAMHGHDQSGDPDADFLAMMVPHHQGAIDMARAVLQHGKDPETRRLAEDIIAAQQVEIDSMRRRLVLLRGGDRPGEPYPALSGTRGH
jgi:hypothetical protein